MVGTFQVTCPGNEEVLEKRGKHSDLFYQLYSCQTSRAENDFLEMKANEGLGFHLLSYFHQ